MKRFEKDFNIEKFCSLPIAYAPIYAWVWNGSVTKEETERQLLEMRRLGIRRFYIIPEPKNFRPARLATELEPDYLTEPYFEEVRFAVALAQSMGMECWLYDEGGWPSGGACGKVLKKHPAYARRIPRCQTVKVMAGEPYRKSCEDVLAAFVDGDVMISEGNVFSEDASIDEYLSQVTLFEEICLPDFPDLSRSEATDCFIELTHEKYDRHLGAALGETVTALFTDEPTLPRPFPLRHGILEAYEERYGESPLQYLPALCGKVAPNDRAAEARMRWFDLCSRLFCENFLGKCRAWANRHGMEFTGHMDKDHYLMGAMDGGNLHLMRSLRQFDIPGIDVIWRQIFVSDEDTFDTKGEHTPANGFFPRYASSAAVQQGFDVAMTETGGVFGCGFTYEQMRFVYGYQAIRGVTLFNPMLLLYDRSGHMMAGELPLFREDQACHADLSDWNAYLERLSYITSLGIRVCDTALYYPIRDLWAGVDAEAVVESYERTGRGLEARQVDFDIIDDDVIENASGFERGAICFGDACYRRIVMPRCRYLSDRSKKHLEIFKANGGIVCDGETSVERPSVLVGDTKDLQMTERKTESGLLYCLFHQGKEAATFSLRSPSEQGYFINITEGTIEPLLCENGVLSITLESGETGAVYLTKKTLKLFTRRKTTRSMELRDFRFRRIHSFEIGELDASRREVKEEPITAETGDWCRYVGEEFSGSAIYETEFALPNALASGIVLDLGDVRYTCDVTLNGYALGKRLMPPYRYEIPREWLTDRNRLSIVVKNTPGNQYYHTKSFDKWPAWMITPYYTMTRCFDRETLSSGLFGPVKLFYEVNPTLDGKAWDQL